MEKLKHIYGVIYFTWNDVNYFYTCTGEWTTNFDEARLETWVEEKRGRLIDSIIGMISAWILTDRQLDSRYFLPDHAIPNFGIIRWHVGSMCVLKKKFS